MRKSILALALAVTIGLDALLAGNVFAAHPLDSSSPAVSGAAIVQTALQYLGYEYTTVGNSPSTGFSCIGLVSYVYQSNGIPLPDDLWDAMAYAPPVAFNDLLPGDVLFFQNTVWAGLSHTAIYLGGGKFIQAEWYNRGVVISSFTNDPVDGDYWLGHYLGANRPWGTAASIASQASPSPAPAPSPSRLKLREGPPARIQVAGLNVRVRPSLLAPIGGIATGGTNVVILKQYRTWDWIQLPDGSFGWINQIGIGDGKTPLGGARRSAQPLALARIQANGLRVHVRPNVAAPVVEAVYRGQKVLVMEHWSRWLWVRLPDGSGGWIRSGFVDSGSGQTAGGAGTAEAAPAPVRHLDPLVVAGTRLRARPGLHAPVITLAAPGTRIAILGAWGRWLYGRFPGGHAGWIYRAYIRR